MTLPRPVKPTSATTTDRQAVSWSERLQSAGVARLLLWYLALLIPTLFFKYSYLRSVAGDGLAATLASGQFGHLPRVTQYLLLSRGDLLDVLAIVLVAALVGRLLRIDVAWLVAGTTFVALVVSAANWISFEVAGALIARENVTLAAAWIRQNPSVLVSQPSDRLLALAAILLLVFAAVWSFSAFLLARYGPLGSRARIIVRGVGSSIVAAWIAAAIASASFDTHGAPVPEGFRGYWSATVGSLIGSEAWHPDEMRLPSVARLDSEYHQLVYPASLGAPAPVRLTQPKHPRLAHIVVISLETAPRRYYPITDNPAYPTFFEMGKRGIVSDHHFTTMPATIWAVYSMVSGTYPRFGRSIIDYGDFHADGLAAVLGRHGYETTFIDSYHTDWNPSNGGHHNSRILRGLGFSTLLEPSSAAAAAASSDHGYAAAVALERESLKTAVQRIAEAEAHRTKAFVFVATILGHYPWRTPPGADGQSNAEKLALIARDIDRCVGGFMQALRDRGLSDSVIVVVTGDHGLRSREEFGSLGEDMQVGELSFNVPLLIYAPGVLDGAVRVPFVTSHVDIAPTLLSLVGIHDAPLLVEGSDILDAAPCGRTTFLLSGALRPIDGFYRAGRFFVFNRFSGDVRITAGPPDPCTAASYAGAMPDSVASVARGTSNTLDLARQVFDTTAALFLRRAQTLTATP
jgi:hypothetical protein